MGYPAPAVCGGKPLQHIRRGGWAGVGTLMPLLGVITHTEMELQGDAPLGDDPFSCK